MPATNLNIGMDVWNASAAGPGAIKIQQNATGPVIGHEGRMNDQWIQVLFLFFSSSLTEISTVVVVLNQICISFKFASLPAYRSFKKHAYSTHLVADGISEGGIFSDYTKLSVYLDS